MNSATQTSDIGTCMITYVGLFVFMRAVLTFSSAMQARSQYRYPFFRVNSREVL